MPRPLALAAVVLLGAAPALAQSAGLRGFVTDADDSQPLIGATVLAQPITASGEADGAPRGSATDTDGLYVLPRLAPGRYVVRVSYVGYATALDTLDLGGGMENYNAALRPDTGGFDVIVESERSTGGARVTAGVQAIDPADIDIVPAPDVSGDLATYLTTTPGVVTTGDRGGQLFIRGGEPTQNLVLIDGMALYQPFHVLGFYSAFPSDILAGADLYAGGYPARFGGQVSSVLDIQSRNGNKQQFAAAASVAPFVSAGRIEGPLAKGSTSFVASGRVSVIEQGASQIVSQELPYAFSDVFGKVHGVISPNAQLSLQGIQTYDRGTIGEDVGGAVPEEIRYRNTAIGTRFLYLPNVSALRAEILVNVSQLESEQGRDTLSGRPRRASSVGRLNAETNLTYYLPNLDLKSGLFVRTNRLENSLDRALGSSEEEYFTEAGVYIEPELRVGTALTVQGGLRVQSYPNDGRTYLEPRARIVFNRGAHELSAAGGLYHQEVIGVSDRRDVANVFTAWTRAEADEVPSAWHAIAGYRVTPQPWLEFVVEGYYKALDNLSVAEWTAFPRFTTGTQPATGTVLGLDTRLELRLRDVYGYLSYGLAEVEYDAKGPNLELWYGSESLNYNPPHDRRHQVNALVSTTLAGVDLSARFSFGSGLPFTRALGFDRFISPNEPPDVFTTPGSQRVIYERPFNGRLPTFHRLDLSADRTFTLSPGLDLTAQVALINAYDRANLFYYDTFTLQRVDQLPIIPSFGLKLSIND